MEKGCCTAGCIGKILLIVGGLNWGLVGLGWLAGGGADWNLVHMLLGSLPMWVEAAVYILVGLAAVQGIMSMSKCCNGMCKK